MAPVNIAYDFKSIKILPMAAIRVLNMLGSDDLDLAEVSEIVRLDQALSLAVLREANSAYYGVSGREFNLKEATVRLGTKNLSKIILKQQVGESFQEAVHSFDLRSGSLWEGALGGAFIAESLASQHDSESQELAFVCSLLRDIGKLMVESTHGEEYESLIEDQLTSSSSFAEAEQATFGMDHAEIGAMLAIEWGLPSKIADAIRFHHAPPSVDSENHSVLFDIVHASDILCLWGGVAIGSDGLQYRISQPAFDRLGITRDNAEHEINEMWMKLHQATSLLSNKETERRCA